MRIPDCLSPRTIWQHSCPVKSASLRPATARLTFRSGYQPERSRAASAHFFCRVLSIRDTQLRRRLLVRYPVKIVELPGRKVEVELPGVFSAATVFVDGQPAAKAAKRGQFLLRGADGRDSLIALKTSFLDPVPQVLWAGRTIRVVEPLTWYQWLWTGIPLILVFAGGAIGGALGGVTMVFNIRILRSDLSAILRYALVALLSIGAAGAYVFFAGLFLSAVQAK